ncbi:hypothetical protein ASPWEDRAFT_33548 [Aspergillus wentii DTO 134E9]|uniref:Uncharacterized protein n=1 Tax=Aspergillus wentii DTO 134E9 TaxID=1073089 RepID=A0A1L9RZ77_ASPWE|nr:uncharacterized protein ASPWEDRAFT_33548 [Aspergillus wentii DTO 134E9]OJJ40215.1 hypothetical protein ASPWEDRAFT_33548 [Aspergillus wentii DTO 134E9]
MARDKTAWTEGIQQGRGTWRFSSSLCVFLMLWFYANGLTIPHGESKWFHAPQHR